MKTSDLLLTCIVLLVLISGSQGLQVSINRTPGNDPCGHLQCLNDVTADGNVFSAIAMTIYDITQPDIKIKLASVSGDGAGFSINPAKINEVNGTGSVSRYHSELTLDFHNETDCVYGSFQCELEFMNLAGQIEFSRENTTSDCSDNGCSCSILKYQVSKLTSRVDQVEKDVTDLTLNNTSLESELVYLRHQVEKDVTGLKLNNTSLESELISLRQQVEKDVTDLTLNNTILESELVSLRQQNNLLVLQFDILSRQVSSILNSVTTPNPPIVTSTQQISVLGACTKGAVSTNPREKFMLWGQVLALCDTETDGGGWVIIQRRTKGDIDFYKNWSDYKDGFGTPDTDFWIGNDKIHNLTSQGYTELRVDMEYQGKKYFAQYSTFRVGDELSKYQLTISGYNGTARDSLSSHNGMKFSTPDQDNDVDSSNCASLLHGAWWYNNCYESNLNGVWASNDASGLSWYGVVFPESVSFSEMKVRHV